MIDTQRHNKILQENIQLRTECDVLRREVCANSTVMNKGQKAMKLARNKISHLQRALEKTCTWLAYGGGMCPNQVHEHSWLTDDCINCIEHVYKDEEGIKNCWLQHSMETTKE